jgi:hypothetical protein
LMKDCFNAGQIQTAGSGSQQRHFPLWLIRQ